LHIIAYLLHFRLKSDGKTAKNVPLVGKGFLHLVDHYFWYLPFASVKQGHAVRQKAGTSAVTEEDWDQRWQAIVAEHEMEGAREQLRAGWKAWLAERDASGSGRPAAGAVNSAAPIEFEED
jgi:hypothetical protein